MCQENTDSGKQGYIQVTVKHNWGKETYTVPGCWKEMEEGVAGEEVSVDLDGIPIKEGDLLRIHGVVNWYKY